MELINMSKTGQLMSKTGQLMSKTSQLTSFISNKDNINSKDRYM